MSRKKIKKKQVKAKYPAATLIFYGPNDKFATKAVASVIRDAQSEPSDYKKWYTKDSDIREDENIGMEIAAYMKEHGVKQTVSPDRILGCPHEEGIDYPEGESCPQCPYWEGRDRYTGNIEH